MRGPPKRQRPPGGRPLREWGLLEEMRKQDTPTPRRSSISLTLRIVGLDIETRLQTVGGGEVTEADRELALRIAAAAEAILRERAA